MCQWHIGQWRMEVVLDPRSPLGLATHGRARENASGLRSAASVFSLAAKGGPEACGQTLIAGMQGRGEPGWWSSGNWGYCIGRWRGGSANFDIGLRRRVERTVSYRPHFRSFQRPSDDPGSGRSAYRLRASRRLRPMSQHGDGRHAYRIRCSAMSGRMRDGATVEPATRGPALSTMLTALMCALPLMTVL